MLLQDDYQLQTRRVARGAAAQPAGLPRPNGHAMLRALLEGMAVQVQRQSPAGLETGSARGGSHAGFIATGPVRRSPRPRRCCCLRVFPKKKPAGRRRVSTTISCGTPGHSFVLVETLATEAAGGEPQIPDGWFEMFSWRSEPARVALRGTAAAGKGRRAQLKSQQGALRPNRPARSGATCQPNARSPRAHSLRYAIVHGLHGKACHSGEIWLLRSCCG